MVNYTVDEQLIEVTEVKNQKDYTFNIQVKSEEMRKRLKQVRSYFEENKDLTDAMFYSLQDGRYEVIVRDDMFITFLLIAFKYRCLESLAWQ
ncbi:hypothetical protein ACQCN2_04045 [Brevibacillus ginsengisoli]|uniref:hypothetical protein n=1 Tax=Brevibacillus ginsengisoli TaxID=363854 RepID=UPI003CE72F2F